MRSKNTESAEHHLTRDRSVISTKFLFVIIHSLIARRDKLLADQLIPT